MGQVKIEVDGEQYVMEVAVSNKLQEDALLGTDIPLWVHLVKSLKPEEMTRVRELVSKEECSYTVTTRAQATKIQEGQVEVAEEERESNTDSPLTNHLESHVEPQQDPQHCSAEPTPSEEEELGELFSFDDTLFHPSKPTKPHRTRAQWR